jgi:nitric oxide synthase oxygenase domain/subunit
MDAEIGVRNLADSFRYNVLPDIVQALELTHGKLGHGFETFEDLPEYEKLSMLSKAQAELTYAINWSFIDAKITMSDSLTASMKWCQYDEEFKKKHGYRLPADPCKQHLSS